MDMYNRLSQVHRIKPDGRLHQYTKGERSSSDKAYISLVGMITNTKFLNCPNDFKIAFVQQ